MISPFLRLSKQYFFHKNCCLNLFYSYYVSSWNKRRACLNVVYPVFFRRLRELWHNSGENINSQIFAKQMSWSSVTLFLNIPSKAQEKILNPPKTANNQREIYILQAYMRWTCVRNSQSSCFRRTRLPNPTFRPPKTDAAKMDKHALWITQRPLG